MESEIEGMIEVDCKVEGRLEKFGVSRLLRDIFLDFSGVSFTGLDGITITLASQSVPEYTDPESEELSFGGRILRVEI